jgi:dienelactone hydrolase
MKTGLHFSKGVRPEKRLAILPLLVLSTLFVTAGIVRAQPVPHHFESITVLPDRTIKLSLDGSVSGMIPNLPVAISNQFMQMFDLYPVEASSNLSDWTSLAMPLRTNNNPNPLIVEDTNAPAAPQRFYRTFTDHLLTAFPKPSGPFAVGTVDRVMMDPARTNLYRYSPPTNTFMVTFWYPVDPPTAGVLPARMWDQRIAQDMSLYSYAEFDTNWALITPRLVRHSFPDVLLPAGSAKYPAVLYSHGMPTFRKLISQRVEELASHGYVIAAIDHADCWATEFPDGRCLSGNHAGDVPSRLKDMIFLLDELAVLNANDPLFAGRLDMDRIGVSGDSYGAMVVQTCRSDRRVKCAFLCDATNTQSSSTGLQKPFLVALGESNAFYSEDIALFNKAVTNAVFVQVRGADHFTPCDIGWIAQIPWGRGPALAYNACMVWFFDAYLKGETLPFPTNPEIYNLHRK